MTEAASDETDRDVATLVKQACTGDEQAWQRLWRWLDPRLHTLIRGLRLGRISSDEDERRSVVLELMGRLREADFRRLRLFLQARTLDPRLSLMTWLPVVARRVAIDRLRAHPQYVPAARGGGAPGEWKDPTSLPPPSLLPDQPPPVTRDGTAHQVLAHARQILPARDYLALTLKVQGESTAEIARRLRLAGPEQADRIVRAAFERLRRKFRSPAEWP